MHKISIIIPVFNVEKYLSSCLNCIVNQTYQNLEILLVNDGSTDSCAQICEEFAAKDNRIKVIHKELVRFWRHIFNWKNIYENATVFDNKIPVTKKIHTLWPEETFFFKKKVQARPFPNTQGQTIKEERMQIKTHVQ